MEVGTPPKKTDISAEQNQFVNLVATKRCMQNKSKWKLRFLAYPKRIASDTAEIT